jgi:short subunit dehydrogenase-like uncharacterized protein
MPDILLFGATGYTGRLTAHALARRGANFSIAGRNRAKLQELAQATGDPQIHIAEVGDVHGLVEALHGTRVLITCVGPFVELGGMAARAAVDARVNYIDSTGEGTFVHQLVEEFDHAAHTAGIAMAPSFGFDEVPADVGVALACEGMRSPQVKVTYATPTTASVGTIRSALGILTTSGWAVREGNLVKWRAGETERWSPMPPPLGVRRSVAAPLAIGRIAPLHIDFDSLEVFMTTGSVQRLLLKAGLPVTRLLLAMPAAQSMLWRALDRLPEGPTGESRQSRWTVLVEARSEDFFRNVVITGRDVYGLTAELLAAGAVAMADKKYSQRGVLAPVEAMGLETLQKELIDQGVTIDTFEPA